MQKAYILLFLGIWVAALSYLGFPASWKQVLFVISGFAIIYISFLLYKEVKEKDGEVEKIFDSFIENDFDSGEEQI